MIYDFDEADAALTLLPMAARRALDAAGQKLSLAAYQALSLADRRRLAQLGAAPRVDVAAVAALTARAGAAPAPQAPSVEPSELPPELAAALGVERALDAPGWCELTALDRYVLDKLLRRGRIERLRVAFDEITRRQRP